MKEFFLLIMAFIYILAGINHFRDPVFYLQMMPPYLPEPKLLIVVSGIFEVLLGLLLIPHRTRRFAAMGIVLLLIAVFPANIYMYRQGGFRFQTSDLILLLRLPLQLVLIAWAAYYARRGQ